MKELDNNISDHKWDDEIIKKHGNDRCSKCGMQYEYYVRGLNDLGKWTNSEIESDKEHFENVIKNYQVCVPR